VDDRVSSYQPRERGVTDREVEHRLHVETEIGIRGTSYRDHALRLVDPKRIETQGIQVRGDMTGTASDVGDSSRSRGYELAERAEHGSVEGFGGQFGCNEVAVTLGNHVVGLARIHMRPELEDHGPVVVVLIACHVEIDDERHVVARRIALAFVSLDLRVRDEFRE